MGYLKCWWRKFHISDVPKLIGIAGKYLEERHCKCCGTLIGTRIIWMLAFLLFLPSCGTTYMARTKDGVWVDVDNCTHMHPRFRSQCREEKKRHGG